MFHSIFGDSIYGAVWQYFLLLFRIIIATVSSFITNLVAVQLYSRHFQLYSRLCYCTALFPGISSFIPGRVIVQLYSRQFPALFLAV
jgi:hypothetical protein